MSTSPHDYAHLAGKNMTPDGMDDAMRQFQKDHPDEAEAIIRYAHRGRTRCKAMAMLATHFLLLWVAGAALAGSVGVARWLFPVGGAGFYAVAGVGVLLTLGGLPILWPRYR